MLRFLSALAVAACVFAVVAVACDLASYLFPGFESAAMVAKVADFDFAGYAFGLVAVAVSVAGIYVSIVPESCIGQLKSRVAAHLTPAPFTDWGSIRDQCEARSGIHRPPQVKVLYVLAIWSTIGPTRRHELLEADGLDESSAWFNARLEWFDKQGDRLIAVTLGAIVSLAYLAVPVVHLLLSNRALFAFLCGIYVACVATVLVCAVLYATRLTFVGRFDAEAKHWLPICGSYLAASASPPPSPPPLPSPPASMEAVV